MPIYDFECRRCHLIFEALVNMGEQPACPVCGNRRARRLPAAPALRLRRDDAPRRIAKRARDYLVDGKFSEAARFLDSAAAQVKDERVLHLRDKVHQIRERKKKRG